MTPTLCDAYEILELAVDGDPVTCRPIKDLRKFIKDNLGIVPDGNLASLRHRWMKANFREVLPDATLVQVYRYTQAYLLFLNSANKGIPRNPLVVNKRASRQVGQRDWQNVNADKIANWLSRHDRIIPDIQQDTDNGLPSKEYKALYNLVPHPLIHNVANPPKDILQPHIHEEEKVVPAHEPQYTMRPRGYENQLVRLY
ncbi:hypothetical protein AMTR_s00023p00214570 [Amborella trichopoda]|uniref:Aminotransferase-like plant mobile domain-containing protein n=1 Tax=Amborella trichopoda TaxID=13333 RepID=W1NJS6_AMBTC|nr:hypothetical protein AMTR_s00023p00214570 [Amborella trichopoda]